MTEENIKNALAFIRKNASEAKSKGRASKIFTQEIVDELLMQISKNNGSFAIDMVKFNKQFGWKPEYSRSASMKKTLNKQFPLDNNKEWHVGQINGTEYVFTIVIKEPKKVKKTEE